MQLARILTENSVPFTSVTLLSISPIASISLTFEVKLNSLTDNQNLAEFMEYFNSELDTLGDYNVSAGGKGSLSIVLSGIDNRCASDYIDNSRWEQ